MSTARQRRKSPWSLSSTSTQPTTMVTLVNIMVLNGWLTSFSFHVNQPPHSGDKAISDSDLETPKVKVMGVVKGQGHTVGPESYLFISNQSDQQFLRYSYFEIWPWNIQDQGHEWGHGHILYPTCNRCTSFLFHINRTNHCWDMAKIMFDLEKTHPKFLKKIWQNNSF